VIAAAAQAGKFEFWPKGGAKEWLGFFAAWLTLAVGSIPQQDVFQRVTSARNEKTAIRGTLLGGVIYFCFTFVPIFIVYAGLMIEPSLGKLLDAEDARRMQQILPTFILTHTPMWSQILFFGALLSAILSTASGALLAPTALCTENVIRPFFPRMGDRQFLLLLRTVLVTFALAALIFALNSRSTMYDMVQNAYKVTLVGALVPLAAGIYWKRSNMPGAILSIVFGLFAWLVAEFTAPEAMVPPQLVGLVAAIFGMAMGTYAAQRLPPQHAGHGEHAVGHAHGAGHTHAAGHAHAKEP